MTLPGMKRSDDASLRDGNGLLFHGLVDGGAVLIVHLVELVDQTHAAVRQDQRTGFQGPVPGKIRIMVK